MDDIQRVSVVRIAYSADETGFFLVFCLAKLASKCRQPGKKN